jgi:hypothetical protein
MAVTLPLGQERKIAVALQHRQCVAVSRGNGVDSPPPIVFEQAGAA